jgi:hypothetical protein
MRRGIVVLVLGAAVGLAAHVAVMRVHRNPDPGSLDGELAWMKAELRLSGGQYERIRQLHEASSPRLRALAAQVAQMQQEFQAFEDTRRSEDRVDFVEFARFVDARRAMDRECEDSTRQLVLASAGEMTPAQRAHYLGIVAPAQGATD